jgi:hypothetical protein
MMLRVVQGKGGIDREVSLAKSYSLSCVNTIAGCVPKPICFPAL